VGHYISGALMQVHSAHLDRNNVEAVGLFLILDFFLSFTDEEKDLNSNIEILKLKI
jgi:hypothetical protein